GSSVGTSVRLKSGRSAVRPRPCPPSSSPGLQRPRSAVTRSGFLALLRLRTRSTLRLVICHRRIEARNRHGATQQEVDKIQHDPNRQALWNAICDAIDLVCDHPDSAEARRETVRTPRYTMWQVPIRCRTEDDDWVLLWRPNGSTAEILYIGSRMFR